MKIKVPQNIFLSIAVAAMISIQPLRRVALHITEHPMTFIAIFIYTLLLLHLFITGINLRIIIKFVSPVLIVFVLLLLTWFLHPERHPFYLNSPYNPWDLLFPTGCVYLLGMSLLQKTPKDVYIAFKIAGYTIFILCMITSVDVLVDGVWTRESIYNGKTVMITSNYYLDWGYWLFLSCVIFTGMYYCERKRRYPILIVVGMILVLLYGSRGAVLSYIIFLALVYVLRSARSGNKRFLAVLIIIAVIAVLIIYGVLQNWIIRLAESLNIHSRTLEKLKNGTITDDSNRFLIYTMLIARMIEKPIFGYGIYADRYFMNYIVQGGSAYSHNILLEMMVSFGLLGLAFMIAVFVLISICFRRVKDYEMRIILLICVGGCIPLLWSLTFWSHPMFWVLLAMLFNYRRTRQKIV